MKKTMLWAFPAACLVVFCAGAGAVGMDIPLPKLKYEETSVEQDRLVRAARRLDEQTPAEAQAMQDYMARMDATLCRRLAEKGETL